LNTGTKIIQIATFIVTAIFNEDYNAILKIMDTLDIVLSRECHCMRRSTRKSDSHNKRSLNTKEAHTARRLQQIEENEFYEE